jgi:hypothetical protein
MKALAFLFVAMFAIQAEAGVACRAKSAACAVAGKGGSVVGKAVRRPVGVVRRGSGVAGRCAAGVCR